MRTMRAGAYLEKYGVSCCTYERWSVERAEGCYQTECPDCKRVLAFAKKEGVDVLAQFPRNGSRVPDLVAVFKGRQEE